MLVPLAQDIWHVSAPVKLPAGARLDTRMTVVRLASGDVLLHSPVRMAPETQAAVAAIGPVRFVIAPNLYHHLFVGHALAQFPDAKLFAPSGLAQKRPDLPLPSLLSGEPLPGVDGELVQVLVEGAPKMNEVVFFHQPSGTLITSDLVFNVLHPEGLMTRLVMSLMGTNGQLAKSRMWGMLVKDRAAFDASVARILAWDTSRLIMAHGDVVEQNAGAELARVLA